ncbi:hypothetical protein [Streptomyces sp. CA2R106]|uniref:hypothetical protein n=1 Tax=Streptomyces sp. CA2R106 TaxID=3120153 RepID=UPI003009F865
MGDERYTIESEPEVRLWLANIPAHRYVVTEQKVDRLSEDARGGGGGASPVRSGRLRGRP